MPFGKRYIRTTTQILRELKAQFIQSTSPKQTALSVAIGFYAGIFPVFGLTHCALHPFDNHLQSESFNLGSCKPVDCSAANAADCALCKSRTSFTEPGNKTFLSNCR